MKTIKIILNSKTDSFGTKTIAFIAEDGKIFKAYADEGSHYELEVGNKVSVMGEIKDGNVTL